MCKFFGDESEASTPSAAALATMSEEDRKVSFHHKSVPARAAIVAAGPIANFLLAIVIFAGLYTIYGKPSVSARVDTVEAGSAAAAAGFQAGDIVTAIDGTTIETFSDMQRIVSTRAGQDAGDFGQARRFEPRSARDAGAAGDEGQSSAIPTKSACSASHARQARRRMRRSSKVDPITALGLGVEADLVRRRRDVGLYRQRVFTGQGGGRPDRRPDPNRPDFGAGRHASASTDLINLTAVLSVSIGLLNLFPVPLLDGGHLMYLSRSRPFGAVLCPSGPRKWASGSVWRWF